MLKRIKSISILFLWALALMGTACTPITPMAILTPAAKPSPTITPTPTAVPSLTATFTPERNFPESIYPPPLKPNPNVIVTGGGGCPNLQGVEVAKPSKEELFVLFSKLGQTTKEGALELSDRAFWPVLEEAWERGGEGGLVKVLSIEQIVLMPAIESPYADLVRNYCGDKTLELSWCVAVLPEVAHKIEDAPGLTSYYYIIKRSGRWLIWFNPH